MAFDPTKHLKNLKGQAYLETKNRLIWFNEERPNGSIQCTEVGHDPVAGWATFHARVSYWMDRGDGTWVERVGEGNGSETRKDFNDYYEKAATKGIGRALAMIGYGTQFATELEEGERVVDSPVERPTPPPRTARPPRHGQRGAVSDGEVEALAPAATAHDGIAVVCEGVNLEALRADVGRALAADADAASRLPKTPAEMNEAELSKSLAWLNRRARALSS